MKVATLIEDAKRYVVGYYEDDGEQYVHWTEDDWLSYVRLAIGIIATADTELFTSVVDVKLQPGSVQELPEQCTALRSVRGQRNEQGHIEHIIRKRSSASLKLSPIRRPTCKQVTVGDGDYKVKSYTVDNDDPKMIVVDPPVPSGTNATMVITCYAPPKLASLDEDLPLDDTQASIVFELILYYAWGVDIEDQASRERSNQHWNNALKLMEIKDRQTEKLLKQIAKRAVTNG